MKERVAAGGRGGVAGADGCPYVEPDAGGPGRRRGALRLAIAGKGGSGKTTIAGTLARLLAARDRTVLAVDGDTNPNLGQALGLPTEGASEIAALPGDLLKRVEDEAGARTVLTVPAQEVLARYGRDIDLNIRLLVMGRVDHAGAG
ncbi:MAG: AAA family ATPase [Gemmatimonadetes bacterium]|nr:AAA family ATPase [Gemmatimonadota bacterium]